MASARQLVVALLLVLAASGVSAWQGSPPRSSDDPLAALAPLVGRWEGTAEGQPGTGPVEREYRRALGERFLRVSNRSVYPPQAKNPKGETHEDEGWFSYDQAHQRLVFRQFHSEGFVNHYVQEGSSLTFVTESIENIPPGWRARETYVLTGADSLEETFELAGPGRNFEVYSRSRLTRVKTR